MIVSVIIPVYNVKPYLERCVHSVLNQTYKDLEIILVDDGSTDGSGALCEQIAAGESRIRVVHQQNQGLSGARNTGIHQAQGKYVIFLDSDDTWLLDDGLEKLVQSCNEATDLICFKAVDIWKDGHKTYAADYNLDVISNIPNSQDLFSYLVQSQSFRFSAAFVMIRLQVLIENEIYFPSRRIGEDFFWHMHLWQYVQNVRMVNINMYGYWHRQGSITTSNVSLRPYRDYAMTFEYWENQYQKGCVNGKAILAYMANIWVNRGYCIHMLKSSDRPEALEILRKHVALLDYAATPKAKRTAKLVRLFGIKNTTTILGLYWRLRDLIMGHAV